MPAQGPCSLSNSRECRAWSGGRFLEASSKWRWGNLVFMMSLSFLANCELEVRHSWPNNGVTKLRGFQCVWARLDQINTWVVMIEGGGEGDERGDEECVEYRCK